MRLKILSYVIFSIFIFSSSLSIISAESRPSVCKKSDCIIELIKQTSDELGYDPFIVPIVIAQDESGFNTNVRDGDMQRKCPSGKYKGKPVRARGIYQITQCYHPEITDAQAYDPVFATRWAIQKLIDGKCKQEFSTCPLNVD